MFFESFASAPGVLRSLLRGRRRERGAGGEVSGGGGGGGGAVDDERGCRKFATYDVVKRYTIREEER